MNVCTLVNYNIDGAISEILLSRIFQINIALKCGYGKVGTYLKNGALYEDKSGQPYDKLIVSSFALPKSIFESLSEHYTSSLSVIDHHSQTEYCVANNNFSAKITWDTSKSSAMLIYEAIRNVGKVDVSRYSMLAKAADIYEMWRTDDDFWGMAYAMNILFWHYNGYKFVERFMDGAGKGEKLITDEEKTIISNAISIKQDTIKKGIREVFDEDSVLYLNVTTDVVSDISLQKENRDIGVFFIVHNNIQGKQTISIRKAAGYYATNTPLNAIIGQFCSKSKNISGGGHANVGSITFLEKECSIDDIIEIVKHLNDKIKGKTPKTEITFSDTVDYDDDVPF